MSKKKLGIGSGETDGYNEIEGEVALKIRTRTKKPSHTEAAGTGQKLGR